MGIPWVLEAVQGLRSVGESLRFFVFKHFDGHSIVNNIWAMDYKDKIIGNVSDYLIWIKEINNVENAKGLSFKHSVGYYRGQACKEWELRPSMFRETPCLDENSLLKKATLRLWNEISSLDTYLEKMIFFQHYGLSTRLLDVTFNPLIALYFACSEESSCDGAVYSGYHFDNQNPQIAELTAKYVFENEMQETVVGFQRFAEKDGVKIEDFTQPIFILPPINNPRIEAQNGAFVMAPLFEKVIDNDTAKSYRKRLDESGLFEERRATIKANIKERVLHELSVLGIDCGTIYKDIEKKMKSIVAEEKRKSNNLKNIQS